MRLHSIDDRERDGGGLVSRRWWLFDTPRLMPLCRLRGHRPVVDGVDYGHDGLRSRWACCDRCGIRLLQPVDDDLLIGQRYTDPLPVASQAPDVRGATGVVGAELKIGRAHSGFGAEFKVGNKGSESTLAAHLHLGRFLWLSGHTERHGTWLQRRLNPTGYESRVVGVSVHDGSLHWKVWAKRNSWSSTDPKWQQGSISIDVLDRVLGPKRYSYVDHGERVSAVVRMPHGDEHEVTLQLQRQSFGRTRGRSPELSWCVDWDAPNGIPTRSTDRGRVTASAVPVTDAAAEHGGWVEQACARIAADMTDERVRYGFAYQGEAA